MRVGRRAGRCALLVMLLCCGRLSPAVAAEVPPVGELELKAAYIYNFVLFTQWSPQVLPPGAVLMICADEQSPLREPLLRLQGKTAAGHSVSVRMVGASDSAAACHVHVFSTGNAVAEAPGRLTIADGAEGTAVVRLVVESERLRFDIDLAAATRAQLHLSSKLLRLARQVQ